MNFRRLLFRPLAIGFLLLAFASSAHASGLVLAKNHQLWDQGPDILALQQWLNANGYPVAQTGAGSPGRETDTFGPLTYEAVSKFQQANGLPASGYLGPLTRAKIAELTVASTSPALTSTQTQAVLSLLQSFGADQTVINSVSIALGGTPASTIESASTTSNSIAAASSTPAVPISIPAIPGGYTPGYGGGENAASCSISASATQILDGQSTTLSWSSSNATSATLNDGSVSPSGSESISPSGDTTYTLSVSGGGGSGSCSVSVDVAPQISSIAATSISTSTETISWTTDKNSTSQVSYGLTTGYGIASSSAALATPHSITLIGLTASTTYDFVVSSADANGNTATSTNQTFTTAAYTYYVDSVNGNDSNPGTSPSLALKDITALPTITAGQSIGLADGSYFRGSLVITANNVTLASYGSGSSPVIDGSLVIPSSCWTFVSGSTYTCSIAGPGGGNTFIGLWECKTSPCTPTGAGGNDTFMANETSLASVEATPGSYYITSMTANPLVIDYQASDGSNPATNGYVVTYAYGVGWSVTGSNATVTGVISKKSENMGGSCEVAGSAGGPPTLTNVECDQGTKHNVTLPSGSVLNGVKFYDAYCPANVCGGTGNMLVFFDQNAQNLPISITNAFYFNSVNYAGSTITAAFSHTGDSNPMGAVTVSGGEAEAVGSGNLEGLTFNNVASLTVSNFVCNQLAWCVIPYGNETLNNVQCVSDILNNICFSSGSDTGNTMTFNNVSACVSHQPYPKGIIYAGNATLNLTGYVGYIKSPSTSPNHIADNGTGNLALTVNNSIFDSNVSGATPYHLTGTGNTFSGGETGFGNAYVLPDVYNLIFNNTVYTIPNWKAAVTPQDSAAVTTGSGLSACTLP